MDLRLLAAADAAEFWALRLRGFRDEPESFGSSYEEQARRPLSEVVAELAPSDPDADFVLGAFTPTLVGIAGLRREPRLKRRHRAVLWGMHVATEARGQGIGRALVEEVVLRARAAHGLEQIHLTVMAGNPAAIALYQATGFEIYGRAPRAMLLGKRSFDELLMWRDLRRR